MPAELFRTPRAYARLLTPQDTEAGQGLLERCADFYDLVGGAPPAPDAFGGLRAAFPPGVKPEACVLVGFFLSAGGELAALAAWARDYPSAGIWFLDLMLVAPEHRRARLGEELFLANERWVRAQGATSIALTVVEQNVAAYRFWKRMAFADVGRAGPVTFMSRNNMEIHMRKS